MNCHHLLRHHRDRHGKKIKLRKDLNTPKSLNILSTNDNWMFQRVVPCIIQRGKEI